MAKSKRVTTAEVPQKDIQSLLGPIGVSGTQFFTGFYNILDDLEYVVELKGQNAIDTYNRMRKSDGQVKLALLSLENPLLSADWYLHPPGDPEHDDMPSAQELEATKALNEWFFGDTFQFKDTLRRAFAMFWAGFSPFEKVWEYDEETGMLVIAKLEQRLPHTIREWVLDPVTKKLSAIRQVVYSGQTRNDVLIPIDKCVIFTLNQEGDDYRGQSVLRTAYKHWFMKDFFYRIDAMRIERWGLGVPVIQETDTAPTTSQDKKTSLIEAAKNIRGNERGYAFMPKGYELKLLDASSGKMVDPLPSIQHHDAQILKTIVAHFLELGQAEVGARSLGETLRNQFLLALQSIGDNVCGQLNREVVTPVSRYNFGDKVRPPSLCVKGIQIEDIEKLSAAFNALGNSGLVTPGPKMEGHIREVLAIPAEDETIDTEDDEGGAEEPDTEGDGPAPSDGEKKKKEVKAARQKTHKHSKIKNYVKPTSAENGLETAPQPMEFWRPLRTHEERVALRTIAGKLDDAREAMVRITRDARKKLLDELMPQFSDAVVSGDPAKISGIDYSDKIMAETEAAVRVTLIELYDFGRMQVNAELDAQKKGKKTEAAATKKPRKDKIAALFDVQAKQVTETSFDRVVDFMRGSAVKSMRSGVVDPKAIRDEAEEYSENEIRKVGGLVTNDAMQLGRDDAADEREAEIEYAMYSAILDGNVCEPCARLDLEQKQYVVGSPEYDAVSPPYKDCEGTRSIGSFCRCMWIYFYSGVDPESGGGNYEVRSP